MGGGNVLFLKFLQATLDATLLMVVLNAKAGAAVCMSGVMMHVHIGVSSSAHTPPLASASCRVALMCDRRAIFGREKSFA